MIFVCWLFQGHGFNRDRVMRPLRAVLDSYRRANKLQLPDREALLTWQHALLGEAPGVAVDAEAVAARDYRTLRRAFAAARLEFDPRLADAFVRPALFTQKEALSA